MYLPRCQRGFFIAPKTNMATRLTEKQERFCVEFAKNGGNAMAAAAAAGYAHPQNDANRVLESAGVQARIAELRVHTIAATAGAIADAAEVQQLWTELLRDVRQETKDRLKASELLAKAHGLFLDKVQHSVAPETTHWLFTDRNPWANDKTAEGEQ